MNEKACCKKRDYACNFLIFASQIVFYEDASFHVKCDSVQVKRDPLHMKAHSVQVKLDFRHVKRKFFHVKCDSLPFTFLRRPVALIKLGK